MRARHEKAQMQHVGAKECMRRMCCADKPLCDPSYALSSLRPLR
jgi:hypothetical protein